MSDRDQGGVRVLGTDGGAADLGARLGELQTEDAELRARLAQAEEDLAHAETELAEIQDSAGGAPASPRVVARRIVALAQAEEAAREILAAADREASRRRAEATEEARRIVDAASREAAAQLAVTREEMDRRIVEARAAREAALVDLNAARVERDRALDALAGVRTALLRAAEGLPRSAVDDALAQSGLLGAAERAPRHDDAAVADTETDAEGESRSALTADAEAAERAEAERAEAERAEAERAEAERAEAERAEAERAEAERAEAERAEAERAEAERAAAAAAAAEAAEAARREAEEAAAREAEAAQEPEPEPEPEATETAAEGPDSPDALFHFDDLFEGDVEPAAPEGVEPAADEAEVAEPQDTEQDTEREDDDEAVTPRDEVSSSSVRPISLVAVVDDDEAVADGSTEVAETAEAADADEAGEELAAEDHADATRTIIPVHERRSGSRRDPSVVTSAAPTEIVVPGGRGRDHTGGRTGPHRRQAFALIGAILVVAAAASPIVISGVRDSSSKTTTLGPSQRHTNAGPAGTIKPGSSASAKPTKNPAPAPGDTCNGSSGWQKKRVDHALTTLSYPWRKLGYKVNAAPAKDGVLATISTAGKEITAYVRSCADESSQQLAGVIAHQIGVAIDDVHGNSTLHKAYLRVRGLPSDTPWFPCATCDPTRSGVWDYAESFVTWQLGSPAAPMPLGAQPDANQLPRLTPMYPS